jgi:hypothetical protein
VRSGALNSSRNTGTPREPWRAVAFGQPPDVMAAYSSSALYSTRCANVS